MAEKDDKPGGFSVSRRDFLKTAGVVSAVTALTTPAVFRKSRRLTEKPPGLSSFSAICRSSRAEASFQVH